MDKTRSLYKKFLMDHAQHPRYAALLNSSTHSTQHIDRVCGDQVQVTVIVNDDRISDIGIQVDGCALAVAAGSVFAEWSIGKSISDVMQVSELGIADLLQLDEIPASRRSCVLLAHQTTADLFR